MDMPRPTPGFIASLASHGDDAMTFRERLDRTIAGDTGALGELFVSHGDLVFGTARRLTGSAADAEDVTQDLFVRLPAALRGFTGGHATFDAWIRRVAVRQALMHLRSGRRRRETSVEGVASLVMRDDHALERLSIEDALERLSPGHRTVFLLKEVEGYEHSEIADLLGISVANSEVRLHRARRQLRDLLGGSR